MLNLFFLPLVTLVILTHMFVAFKVLEWQMWGWRLFAWFFSKWHEWLNVQSPTEVSSPNFGVFNHLKSSPPNLVFGLLPLGKLMWVAVFWDDLHPLYILLSLCEFLLSFILDRCFSCCCCKHRIILCKAWFVADVICWHWMNESFFHYTSLFCQL